MEENKKIIKGEKGVKGVTMLALVVTIIVLLILAAITLNLAVGENGIIKRAKLARDKAKNASIQEEEAMNLAADEIDNAENESGSGGSGEGGTGQECPDTKPLEDRIKELESQVGVLQQQLEEERENKIELENRITALNNKIAELNKQIEAGNTEKAKLQEEITKLQNQLIASQTENEKLQAQIAELNKQVTDLNTEIGEKNNTIETQKQTIANLQGQIIEKDKIIVQKNETIKTMQETIDGLNTQIANLNRQIETLKTKQATGNVAVSEVLAEKTFSNSSGVGLVGTMANNGALNASLNAGQSYNIPAGYTSGGTIVANSLASQTPGTATANNLSNGVTAWVNGQKITGNGTDVNNSYNNGHSAGYNEGYNIGSSEVGNKIDSLIGSSKYVNFFEGGNTQNISVVNGAQYLVCDIGQYSKKISFNSGCTINKSYAISGFENSPDRRPTEYIITATSNTINVTGSAGAFFIRIK